MSVKVNSWERKGMFVLNLCGSSVIYSNSIIKCSVVSSEDGTLNSVLCSSVQSKTEQLACFTMNKNITRLIFFMFLGSVRYTRGPDYNSKIRKK